MPSDMYENFIQFIWIYFKINYTKYSFEIFVKLHKGGEEGDDIEEQIEKKGKLGKKKRKSKKLSL